MMNRLPLRPRQINNDSSHLTAKVAKISENGSAKENSVGRVKQYDHTTRTKPSSQTSADATDATKLTDDYADVIIEERRLGANGEEHVVQRYIRGKLLGKGGFAKVYLCTVPENKKNFAVKIVPKANLVKPRARQKLQAEIRIHKTMKHRHICEFKHFFEDKENCYIILELCDFQSMNELIKRRKRLTEIETSYFLSQLIDAVNYMHMEQVIHRDLKLGNLFLDKNLHIKVGDFGLAIKVSTPEEKRKTICGTPNYIAPEVIEQDKEKRGHSFEVDVWSMGVICYTLLVGKPPFESKDVQSTYERILSNQYSFPSNIYLSDHAKSLVSMILQINPCHRPSLAEIAAHPFILQYRGKAPDSLPPFCMHTAPSLKQHRDGTITIYHSDQVSTQETFENSTHTGVNILVDTDKNSTFKNSDHKFHVFDENENKIKRSTVDYSSLYSSSAIQQNHVIDSVLSKVSSMNLRDDSSLISGRKAPSSSDVRPSTNCVYDHANVEVPVDFDMLPMLKLYTNLCDAFSLFESSNRKPIQLIHNPSIDKWITHHIDYTSKYGLGFLLNDGSVGVYFNDSTKAVLDSCGESFCYIDRKSHHSDGSNQKNVFEQYLLSDFPPHLQKKVILLKHFKNYLLEHCEKPFSPSQTPPGTMVYLKKWVRTKHAVFFRLSDNTVQVVFSDNTEIVLCSNGSALTFVDKAAVRISYSVESCLLDHSLSDVKKRLKYLKDILHQLLEGSRK